MRPVATGTGALTSKTARVRTCFARWMSCLLVLQNTACSRSGLLVLHEQAACAWCFRSHEWHFKKRITTITTTTITTTTTKTYLNFRPGQARLVLVLTLFLFCHFCLNEIGPSTLSGKNGKAMNVKSQKCVGGASEHTAKHTTLPEDLLPDILSFVVNCYAEPSFCWVDDPCDWLNPQYGHYHYWCGFCALKVENDRNEKRLFDAGCEDCDVLRSLRTVSKKFQSMAEVPE